MKSTIKIFDPTSGKNLLSISHKGRSRVLAAKPIAVRGKVHGLDLDIFSGWDITINPQRAGRSERWATSLLRRSDLLWEAEDAYFSGLPAIQMTIGHYVQLKSGVIRQTLYNGVLMREVSRGVLKFVARERVIA